MKLNALANELRDFEASSKSSKDPVLSRRNSYYQALASARYLQSGFISKDNHEQRKIPVFVLSDIKSKQKAARVVRVGRLNPNAPGRILFRLIQAN